MIRSLAMLAVLGTFACTGTATIAEDVCGNDVLDPGEDCDQPGSACTPHCRIVCNPDPGSDASCSGAIDGTCCPTGFACGQDSVCHAPAGTVSASPITVAFDVIGYTTTDINGDGIADAMGYGTHSVNVLYGDLTTPLGSAFSTPAPPATSSGSVGFGDFDGDGRIDLGLPTLGGVFAFETPSGRPAPVQFPAATQTGVTPLALAAVQVSPTDRRLIVYDAIPPTGSASSTIGELSSLDIDDLTAAPVDAPQTPCGGGRAAVSLQHGQTIHPAFDALDLATIHVPFEASTAGSDALTACVASLDVKGTNPTYLAHILTIANQGLGTVKGAPQSGGSGDVFFADVLAGACPDLVLPGEVGTTGATVIVPGKQGTGNTCTVDVTAAFNVTVGAGSQLAGFPLAAVKLIGGKVAIVTSIGVVVTPAGGLGSLLTVAPHAWQIATVADVDGDGNGDIIAATLGTGVDVLEQRAPIGPLPQWRAQTIPTDLQPAVLVAGDYDGDGAGDVGIASVDPTNITGAADLAIAYGGGGTFALQDVGPLTELGGLVSFNLVDPTLPVGLDQYDDLVVARGGADLTNADDPALLIAEYGSSSREITAPFVERANYVGSDSGAQQAGQGEVVQTGHFGFQGGSGTNTFALFEGSLASRVGVLGVGDSTGEGSAVLVPLIATDYGAFITTPGAAVTTPVCDGADGTGGFCLDKAHYMKVPMSETADEMLVFRSDTTADTTECAKSVLGDGTLVPVTLSCQALVGSDADIESSPAFASLNAPVSDRILSQTASAGSAEILLGTGARAIKVDETLTYDVFSWNVNASNGTPVLSAPFDFNADLAPFLPTGDQGFCMDASPIELGTRTIDGVTYGEGMPEMVAACGVGPAPSDSDPRPYSTQLWARYAPATAGGKPYWTLLDDLKMDITVHMHIADMNGDGLGDVLLTYGNSAENDVVLTLLLQCDSHATGCEGGS